MGDLNPAYVTNIVAFAQHVPQSTAKKRNRLESSMTRLLPLLSNIFCIGGFAWLFDRYVFSGPISSWTAEIWPALMLEGIGALLALVHWLRWLTSERFAEVLVSDTKAVAEAENALRKPFLLTRWFSFGWHFLVTPVYERAVRGPEPRLVSAMRDAIGDRMWVVAIGIVGIPYMWGSDRVSQSLRALPGSTFFELMWGIVMIGVFADACFLLALWVSLWTLKITGDN